MVLFLSPLLLALSATLVNAQNQNSSYLTGLLQALNSSGLTTLAASVALVNSTTTGSQFLSRLSNLNQNFTAFAPDNAAFNNIPSNNTQDPNLIVNVISYHFVFGHFLSVTDYPNTTIGRTVLGDPSVVMLEGNRDQVVAWARRSDGLVHVLNQSPGDDPSVEQIINYQNLQIFVINGILLYPGNITSTFQSNGQLSGLSTLAQNTQVPVWDTSVNSTQNVSITQVLSGVRGLTFFAPNNAAIAQAVPQFSGNSTQLWDVLRNHIINGTTVYTPSFVNATYVSAGGENLRLTTNSTGQYVTSGNITALIVQPDVLTENGVVHIIDRVLFNSEVNNTAANNAYSSASSLAGHSSTETGPVGVPTGQTTNNNDHVNGATGNFKGVESLAAVVLSVILGSFFLFA
jgi:uncharacterized surface protein with fasciclin (FAS1) repeats